MSPYLDHAQRLEMEAGLPPTNPGQLTYLLTKQIQRYLGLRRPSYSTYAECLGALEGCRSDFVDRCLKPYEETKCELNGDVWTGRETTHELG